MKKAFAIILPYLASNLFERSFLLILVPDMIWWKFRENRTLGSVKTKLPPLLLLAEWK